MCALLRDTPYDNNSINTQWIKTPYGLRLSDDPDTAFHTLMDQEKFVMAQDISDENRQYVRQWMEELENASQTGVENRDNIGQGNVFYSKPNYTDTRVGGNDAINPYWQFNIDDDICPPILNTNLKDEDMWTETNEYDIGLRKYIHQALNEKYFGGKADPSGQNASRLARAPNAIRQDEKHPGKKQICLQFNMDAKALDVSSLVEDYKEEKKLSRIIKELTAKPPIPEEMRKEPSVHTLEDLKAWNTKAPSKAKQECIEFLEGTLQDWNRGLACVRELRNFGFTDCEIEFEGPANDRWIKAALKAAH